MGEPLCPQHRWTAGARAVPTERMRVCSIVPACLALVGCSPIKESEDVWVETAAHVHHRAREHAMLKDRVMLQLGRIPAGALDLMAKVMKPCAENLKDCRGITDKVLPACPERDLFLQKLSVQAQQELAAVTVYKKLKAAAATLDAAFQKAERFYEAKGPNGKTWSSDPQNTAASDSRWGEYDSLRAASEKEAGKVRELQQQSDEATKSFEAATKAAREGWTKLNCPQAEKLNLEKMMLGITSGPNGIGDASWVDGYTEKLPFYECNDKKKTKAITLVGENGETVKDSDCGNYGYTEDGCKLKCFRVKECHWALIDTAAKGCGGKLGFCGLNSNTNVETSVSWNGKSCHKKFGMNN